MLPHAARWLVANMRLGGAPMIAVVWARGLGGSLLAGCAGVALQLQQAVLWPLPVYAGLLALAGCAGLACRRWCPARMRRLAWCLVWMAVAFSVTGLHALSRQTAFDPALEGQDLEVVGVVQAMPQRQDLGWRFRFRIEQAWRPGQAGGGQRLDLSGALPAQVYLGWYGREGTHDSGWNTAALPEPVKAGERWRFRVRLKAAHGHMNPRGFDYELWLWEQDLHATGYVRTGAQDLAPVRLASTWAHPVEAWRQSVRDRMLSQLTTAAGDAETARLAGIVAALVTGDQAAIERSDWDVFRATGVAHLMSISGLHVTMFAWLASAVVAWAWRRSALWGFAGALRWPAAQVGALSGLMLAGGYALFSGWGLPAQRTWLMLLVVVGLRLTARQWPGGLVWLLAGAVVLAVDPWALLQPGFWLSFVAVGVLMASPRQGPQRQGPGRSPVAAQVEEGRTDLVPEHQKHRWGAHQIPIWVARMRAWGRTLWAEQLTVSLALAPLTLLFFGQVSLVGLLANLLAIPWVTLVVTPLAMLGLVWSGAWVLAVGALQPLSALLGVMSAWPWASVSTAVPPWGLAMLALAGAVGLVLQLPWSWKCLCLPLLWPAVFWTSARPEVGTFELLAADVGQGNAVLVRTAGHSLLYDAGPRYAAESDAGHRVLVPLLSQMGERLDVLMLSHRDSDHTGGAPAVLAMQPQAALWSSLEADHALHGLRPGWTRCERGQSWVWDGVLFEVLHPPPESVSGQPAVPRQARPNAISCVLRISDGHASVLLAGDIEAAQERLLVQSGLAPVDFLLVPHHGSKTSSTPEFLHALNPQLALVQAGYRNRFGHPAASVVARYQALQVRLIDNVHCGALTWRSAAPGDVVCERERARRYWHHVPP